MAKKKNGKSGAKPKPAAAKAPPPAQAIAPYVHPQLSADMAVGRPPERILSEAARVAKVFDRAIQRTQSFTMISGRRHIRVEGWLTLARFFGVTARLPSTEPVSYTLDEGGRVFSGWKAHAEALVVKSGQVIGTADAICTNEEPTWDKRPRYEWRNCQSAEAADAEAAKHGWALEKFEADKKRAKFRVGDEPVTGAQRLSMAETRAISKVLASVFRWVVVMAGYEPTPAEEASGGWVYDSDYGQDAEPEPRAKPKTVETTAKRVEPDNGKGQAAAAPKPAPAPAPVAAAKQPPPAADAAVVVRLPKRGENHMTVATANPFILGTLNSSMGGRKQANGSYIVAAGWLSDLKKLADTSGVSILVLEAGA